MRLVTFMLDLLHPTPPLGGSLIKANKKPYDIHSVE